MNDDLPIFERGAFYNCNSLSRVDVSGEMHNTISLLHAEARNEMNEEIDRINQTLPAIPGGKKTETIQQWLGSIFYKMDLFTDNIFVYTGGEQEVPQNVRRVRIGKDVDTIPRGAFERRQYLVELQGHVGIKKIEQHTFSGCLSLRWVTKMHGVTEIECWAFYGCRAICNLEFDKLEMIGDSAFSDCKSLRYISMPSVRRVEWAAFRHCERLSGAEFGEKLESIKGNAFYECPSLRHITIPLKENMSVSDRAFCSCNDLSRVDVIGEIHKTISSLHTETWRNEMNEEIDSINNRIADYRCRGRCQYSGCTKSGTIRRWIERVLRRMHLMLLKEATTILELALWKVNLVENDGAGEGARVTRGQRNRARQEQRVTSGASIVIKNVLPFLKLE